MSSPGHGSRLSSEKAEGPSLLDVTWILCMADLDIISRNVLATSIGTGAEQCQLTVSGQYG